MPTTQRRSAYQGSMNMDNERAIKAKVLDALRRDHRGRRAPMIATEYCIGTTGVRADLALAYRTPTSELVGIEIKSALDTLRRLPHQIEAYSRIFDRVILVAATRHQETVRQYRLPNLEIWEIEKSGALTRVRTGSSPLHAPGLSTLLPQRDQLRYKGLIAAGSQGERDAFFAAFEDRYGECSAEFWSRVQGRRISEADVAELSRFYPKRAREQQIADDYAEKLTSWRALEAA